MSFLLRFSYTYLILIIVYAILLRGAQGVGGEA